MDLAIGRNHSLRDGWRVFARLKNVLEDQQNLPPKVGAWGIYSLLGKTSRFIAVAKPDTYWIGMTYTAPTVTKLQ